MPVELNSYPTVKAIRDNPCFRVNLLRVSGVGAAAGRERPV